MILFPFILTALYFFSGCTARDFDAMLNPDATPQMKSSDEREPMETNDYYDKFYKVLSHRAGVREGTNPIKALDSLPKEANGAVNWTVAVVEGYINPRGSLNQNIQDEPPLNLNIFLEAKTSLMANVLFPHSIHTYWLSCKNCHPKIFIPEAGANPITMTEIWKGEWCGRCHGKVAFSPFMPRENCVRCHTVLKGQSLEFEKYK